MIGGEHYLTPPQPVDHSLGAALDRVANRAAYFASGRDALCSTLRSLPHTRVLLPDLICHSVYDACIAAGKAVEFYPVDEHLLPENLPDISLDPDSCVFVMHYFGRINQLLPVVARKNGATIISDVTHVLFNTNGLAQLAKISDFLVASLRKSGPFPDGGFASSLHAEIPEPKLPMREAFFAWRTAGLCARGFSAYERFENDENHELLKKAEYLLDQSLPDSHQCSHLSRRLLYTIDVECQAAQIVRNQSELFTRLSEYCRLPGIQDSPSPYFFCVFGSGAQRDRVRNVLAENRYFCPVHWDTRWQPSPSHLSDVGLSIPCDARYSEADMQSISEVILSCQ